MKIAVVGLWHLGSVTAACLAHKGFEVIAYDPDPKIVDDLNQGILPVSEPGLADLVKAGLDHRRLVFTSELKDLSSAGLVWVTYDTPVDDEDRADTQGVISNIQALFEFIKPNSVIVISSQLPVGSIRLLENEAKRLVLTKNLSFACSPENLRLGNALKVFLEPDRIIIGLNRQDKKAFIESIFLAISPNLVWMSVESAEMTKHAINTFLATSVVFINEIAALCEEVGADAREVERGLKSEMRIGPKAYLRPGNAFAGGTLARDTQYLIELGKKFDHQTPLFSGILASNQQHKDWPKHQLNLLFKGEISGKKIALLGLAYKPGTNTLRRSSALEICEWLRQQQAKIAAFDPGIQDLPFEYGFIDLKKSAREALDKADVAVIFTPWPEFESLEVKDLKNLTVIDVTGFLYEKFSKITGLKYITIGKRT